MLRLSSAARVLCFAAACCGLHPRPIQAQSATSTPRRASAKAGIIDQVMKLLQAKLPESTIIKKIQETNTPVNPTTDQLIALKQAGASDNVLALLSDPKSSVGASPATTPAVVVTVPTPPAGSTTTTVTSTTTTKAEVKKRVAVDEFDYSTVKTAVASVFGTTQDIGKGIQSMFVTRIAKEGKVVVVERKKLNQVMAEQNLAASNRVKQGTGAKIGQIRGADAILYGDIVTFGRDDKKKAIAGGGLIGAGIAAAAASRKSDKAVVTIDYRLVDAETSEVIATGEARAASQHARAAALPPLPARLALGEGAWQSI